MRLCLAIVLVFTHSLTYVYEKVNSLVREERKSSWEEYETNRWHTFYSWSRNSPPGRQYAAATSVVDRKPDGTSREMMLMYGGESNPLESTTWIYNVQSNSWEAINRDVEPPVLANHTLVTLCQTRVLSFGGFSLSDRSRKRKCSNDTWSFDMKWKQWRLVNTTISNGNYVTPRCRHTATVVLYDKSPCNCKESMLVHSGFPRNDQNWESHNNALNDLWLLNCKDDAHQVYEWIKFDVQGETPELSRPQLVSVFNKTRVYLFGAALPYREGRYWEVWSFDVAKAAWRKRSKLSKRQWSAPGRAVYLTTRQSHQLLVSCCAKPLTAFDLIQEQWFTPNQSGIKEVLSFQEMSATIAKVKEDIYAFGRPFFVIGASHNRIWCLTVLPNGSWHWVPQEIRLTNPLYGRTFSVAGLMTRQKEVILFGGALLGLAVDQPGIDNKLYRLNLVTRKWSVEVQPGANYAIKATGTVLCQSIMVVYGGIKPKRRFQSFITSISARTGTWGYYNDIRMWVKYQTKREPADRMLHCAATVNGDRMAVYGGFALNVKNITGLHEIVSRRDLWMFTLYPSNKNALNFSAQKTGSYWSLIDSRGPKTSYIASLVAIDDILYLYGGSETTIRFATSFNIGASVVTLFANCSDSLWTYNLSCVTECSWKRVSYGDVGPGRRCCHEAFAFGDHMLVTGGCIGHVALKMNLNTFLSQYECPLDLATSGVWLYKPLSSTWFRLTPQSIYDSGIIGSSSLLWNDVLLSFGGLPHESLAVGQIPADWLGFSFYRPACPAGTTTTDLKIYMCTDCSVGYYTSSSNSTCSPCPIGLTTSSTGSISRANCSQCNSDYCGYGTCTVALQGPAPSCTCQFGFTKDNNGLCTVPAYYIAATGFAFGVGLFTLVLVLVARSKKVKKSHKITLRDKDCELDRRQIILQNKDHELEELTNTWNIDSRELKLRKRIDEDHPGVYVEVYKAEYREMIVAVKKLQGEHRQFNRIFLEFEREIEVMRTIRHPNIVLFLGGGRYHDDDCPFLVVEYMPRGSLTTILSNEEIHLDDNMKLRFAIDAAKGMRFLHSQRPPRIHRDLKSANLLVSTKWIVKVADFGTARLVRDEGINQEAVRGEGFLDLTAPLLHAEYHLSSGVGTPFWCAPEILCGSSYGTAADVYSYGIVMWEIMSRKLPYYDQTCQHLMSAIINGVRPTVPEDDGSDYIQLMRTCWSGNADCRPTFRDVVFKLEEMIEGSESVESSIERATL